MVAKAFPDHVLVERQYLEDIEDDASRRAFEDSRGEESVPSDMVNLLLDGENPIRVSRRHRGLTLEVLATKVGVTKGFLSQLKMATEARLLTSSKKSPPPSGSTSTTWCEGAEGRAAVC